MFEVKNIEDTNLAENPVIAQMSKYNHEQLLFCNDNATGLKAIIAVHNTVLGPALGGTRMWQYATQTEALTDVLRLSRGMTYKNSISGLNLGGGKAVIIGDSKTMKSEALFRRFDDVVKYPLPSVCEIEDTINKNLQGFSFKTKIDINSIAKIDCRSRPGGEII
mgnify:CR=1 FL=1